MTTINTKEMIRDMYEEINSGRNVHDHMKSLSVEELYQETKKDRFPFSVMCLNLTGDANVGAIIRNAILHGAEKVYVFGRRRYDRRGTVGAHNYIDIECIEGFEEDNISFSSDKFYELVDGDNLWPIFVEQGGISLEKFDWKGEIDYAKDDYSAKPCLIMGNETNGIPDKIRLARAYETVSIPQRGVIRSFNVAVTMGMVAWDMRVKMDWI